MVSHKSSDPAPTRVILETGSKWVFAIALDWPGWCRRGKDETSAIESLLAHVNRYAVVAGPGFAPGPLAIIDRVKGTTTTDFGAPDARVSWDEEPLDYMESNRIVGLLEASWRFFDEVVAKAPPQLRKGPRGGGRDRDAMVNHVREAERAYSAKIGARIPPRTSWAEQRTTIADALRVGGSSHLWPVRYAVRRCAWHVLDHAWEIEDKQT